jgi:hypothetical protein
VAPAALAHRAHAGAPAPALDRVARVAEQVPEHAPDQRGGEHEARYGSPRMLARHAIRDVRTAARGVARVCYEVVIVLLVCY